MGGLTGTNAPLWTRNNLAPFGHTTSPTSEVSVTERSSIGAPSVSVESEDKSRRKKVGRDGDMMRYSPRKPMA